MTLARNCYACPLPLTVDGRRIDGFQRSSNFTESDDLVDHSSTPTRILPLFVGDAQAALPALGVAPGTFLELPRSLEGSPKKVPDDNQWETASRLKMKSTTPFQDATLPFLLNIHIRLGGGPKNRYWEESSGPSTAFWVLDGGILAQNRLLSERTTCSVACFLNAEGLETDLTTLDLRDSAERAQRLSLAKQALYPALLPLESITFDEMVRRGVMISRFAGGSFMALGLFSLYATVPVGLILGAVGGGLYYFAGTRERARVTTIQNAIGELRRALGKEAGRG